MSTRRFLGWEASVTTRYIYDGERVVQTIATREPEFDDIETALHTAARFIDDTTCDGCGDDLTETLIDTPPVDAPPDPHRHRFTKSWCRSCIASEKYHRQLAEYDKQVEKTEADDFASARRVRHQRIKPD